MGDGFSVTDFEYYMPYHLKRFYLHMLEKEVHVVGERKDFRRYQDHTINTIEYTFWGHNGYYSYIIAIVFDLEAGDIEYCRIGDCW